MATARAFLRQRSSRLGDLDQVVADVNRQLSRDVGESGRFMTLFFAEIDRQDQTITWVNAGHEPGLVYDQHTGSFTELPSTGLPLGVSANTTYQKSQRAVAPGQIVLIGTDGIWEAQNAASRMFGKDRFKKIIRQHASRPAREILNCVLESLEQFSQRREKSDDVTLVVVKVTES